MINFRPFLLRISNAHVLLTGRAVLLDLQGGDSTNPSVRYYDRILKSIPSMALKGNEIRKIEPLTQMSDVVNFIDLAHDMVTADMEVLLSRFKTEYGRGTDSLNYYHGERSTSRRVKWNLENSFQLMSTDESRSDDGIDGDDSDESITTNADGELQFHKFRSSWCGSQHSCDTASALINACMDVRGKALNIYSTINEIINAMDSVIQILCGCVYIVTFEKCFLQSVSVICQFPYKAYSQFSGISYSIYGSLRDVTEMCLVLPSPLTIPKFIG